MIFQLSIAEVAGCKLTRNARRRCLDSREQYAILNQMIIGRQVQDESDDDDADDDFAAISSRFYKGRARNVD